MTSTRIVQPDFGQRLLELRTGRGISQRALAGTSMTPSYISLIERGERVPTLDVAVQLARTLEVPVAQLLGADTGTLEFGADRATDLDAVASQLQLRSLAETGDLQEADEGLVGRLDAARARHDGTAVLAYGLNRLPLLAAQSRHQERLALLDELLALPVVADAVTVRVPLAVDRVAVLRELGRLGDARADAEALRRLGPEAAGEREFIRLLGVLVSVLCELGDVDPVGPLVGELLRRAEALGHAGMLGRAHWVAALAYVRTGRPAEARGALDRAGELLSYGTMPVLDWLRFCRSTATVLLDLDAPDAALPWLEAAEHGAALTGLRGERTAVLRERAHYELVTGDNEAAAKHYAELCAGPDMLAGLDLITALLGHGSALELLGRNGEAVAVLRRAAELCEEAGNFRQAAETWRRIDRLREAADTPPAKPQRRRRAA
jgi:transcriptional regulator with XRE-family HTH domain/tetratricopeptide (TPR) repeat protein